MRRPASLLAVPLSLAACSSAGPPPPPPPPAPSASALPPPPPPARWIAQHGHTDPGVRLGSKGTLALVGGRRALIGDDGAVQVAKAGPVDLERLEVVPAPGGPRVVGLVGRRVHSFEDPVGEGRLLARLPYSSRAVSTWPGRLGFRGGAETLWIDLDGKPAAPPATPLPPIHVAFLDAEKGIALFPAAGLAQTADGGVTWTLIDGYPSSDLDARGGFLRVHDREIAPDGRHVDPPKRVEPALVRFLRAAGMAPLEAAARAGVDIGGGRALVAAGAELFAVDLATGEVAPWGSLASVGGVDLASGAAAPDELQPGLWRGALLPGKGGKRAFFYTADTDGYVTAFRPLVSLDLATKAVAREPVASGFFAGLHGTPVASTTGGLLVTDPCGEGEVPSPDLPCHTNGCTLQGSCVRQPDGTFKTVWHALEMPGPTAAGGLVGWSPQNPDDGSRELVVVDKTGKPRVIAKGCGERDGRCEPATAVDELADGVFSALVEVPLPRTFGPGLGVARASGGALEVERISGLAYAKHGYFRGRGAVEVTKGLAITTDGGRTFQEAPAPAQQGSGAPITVGELGLVWGSHVRLGWGAPEGDVPGPPAADDGAPTIPARAEPKAHAVSCEGSKDAKALPIWVDAKSADAALAPPPPKGVTVSGVTLASGLRAHARVEIHRSEGGKKKPQLVARWVDHTELGAKVRTASAELAAEGFLAFSFVEARGDRAFFALQLGGVLHLARASGGKLELVEARGWRVPRDAAIAQDGAIAWASDEGVGHWPAKGRPALLARARPAQLAVAAPTKDGVPLVVGERGWASFRVVPVPKGPAPSPPPWLDVGGWRRVGFGLGELGALPACGAKAPPHRFVFKATTMSVAVPGAPYTKSSALAVRADGEAACLEGLTARLKPQIMTGTEADAWARVDLVKKRGEGAASPKAAYALTCNLQ